MTQETVKKYDDRRVRDKIIKTASPVFLELVISTLFGMVDMMMLGNISDKLESAASVSSVGITNQMVFLGISLIQAFCVGGTALVSRYYGANEREKLQSVLKHVVILSVTLVGIPLFLCAQFFPKELMTFIGANEDHLRFGLDYFKILGFGVVVQSYKFAITACLRGVQDTVTPMKINLFASFINVIGNYLLIYGKFGFPRLGVTGAGISTVLCWFVASVIMTYYLLKKEKRLSVNLKDKFKFNNVIVMNMIKIGLPSGLEQLALRVGIFFFVKIILSLGTFVHSTHVIVINVYSLSFMPGQAFGIAAAALVGHALGAKDKLLAKEYMKESKKLGLYASLAMGLLFFFAGEFIISLYTDIDEIIVTGSKMLKIVALVQPFQTVQLLTAGGLRGAGDTVPPLIATFVGLLVVRTILSRIFVLDLNMGLTGAWLALAIEQLIRYSVIEYRYRTDKWMNVRLYT